MFIHWSRVQQICTCKSSTAPYFKLNVWCPWCRCELLIYDCLWKRIRCWQDLHHHIHKFFHSYPILFCSWSDIVLNVKVVFSYFNFDVTENGVYHVTNSMLTKEVENDGLVRPDFVNNNIFSCWIFSVTVWVIPNLW